MVEESPFIGFESEPVRPGSHTGDGTGPVPYDAWTAASPSNVVFHEDPLVSMARHFHKTRRAGKAIFGQQVISDPQYDMLLELFIAHHEGRTVLTTDLCRAAGVPATTALRHIDKLQAAGFLRRLPDSSDARRNLVVATDEAVRCTKELLGEFRKGLEE